METHNSINRILLKFKLIFKDGVLTFKLASSHIYARF